ncbi:unnamed protein product [Chondrus crispus]|uniref:VHS domain-containing protein n=1 Tax=Chondrus crispus TaxID=2769 RepID=R7Q825_CHOCR|nr:unnamed protein product [Chondrus crispus]CDF33506.1 unnamed protein product [Chondrus crispus]|eukprot:XP_005713309.1 unnamed protein product [Chondrus crispus]
MRGSGSEISERVRILIRAWAEELSVMQKGRYDPDAGFLMERYNNKRSRVNFPPVPETPLPWVCPVSHGSASSSRRGGKKEEKLTLTLAEVENTVSLFSNIVDNAKSVTDLKDEVCSDMAERCLYIKANLSRMSMNMSKETELTRAIAVSELLEKSLTQYRSSLESGRIVKSIPTVDTISLQSEDEGYGDLDRRQTSSHSLDRYHDSRPRELERRQSRYTDESDHSSAGVVTYPPEDKPYKPRDRSRSPAPRRRESSPDQRRPSNSSIEKRSRRDPKKSLRRREKSDSDLVELAKQKEKMKIKKKKAAIAAAKKDQGLIQLPVEDTVFSSSSDSEDENAAKDGSTLLAERYASRKGSKTSQSQAASSSRSVALNGSLTSVPPTASAASPAVPGSASSAGFPPNPAAMYQSVGSGMGYNPMMMVPNPYAMYGSVNPMPMADPMNMYGAYQTVNPAMYYNTVNPHMYATHHMQMMPGVQPGVGPAHPNPQANAQSADGTPSPGQSSQNMFMPAAPPANAPQAVPQPSFPTPSEPQQSAPNMTTANPGTQAAAMPSHPMASFYSSSAGQAQMGSQGGFPFMMQPASAPAPFLQTAQTDMPAAPDALTVQMSQQNNPNAQAFAYQSAMHQAAAAYHAAAEAYRSVSGQAPIGAPQANNSGNPPMGQNRGGGGD